MALPPNNGLSFPSVRVLTYLDEPDMVLTDSDKTVLLVGISKLSSSSGVSISRSEESLEYTSGLEISDGSNSGALGLTFVSCAWLLLVNVSFTGCWRGTINKEMNTTMQMVMSIILDTSIAFKKRLPELFVIGIKLLSFDIKFACC